MKGVVFTIFLDMVDDVFGVETTEYIISNSNLKSGGVYTSVGTYHHDEIVELVNRLSKKTSIAINDLVKTFGTHLLGKFYEIYPDFFHTANNVLEFLECVDGYVHGEVLKLYPDATLPKLETTKLEENVLEIMYRSDRMMGDLAEGLIKGAIDHYGTPCELERDDIKTGGKGQCVNFTLKMIK